jgi:hypothetical protein
MVSDTDSQTNPLYYILLCTGTNLPKETEQFKKSFKELEKEDELVEILEIYNIGLEPETQENFTLVFNPALLINHVEKSIKRKDEKTFSPVIFVGIGFAAFVVMDAVCSVTGQQLMKEKRLEAMGVLVASGNETSQKWYQKLANQDDTRRLSSKGDDPADLDVLARAKVEAKEEAQQISLYPELSRLEKVLGDFNSHCRDERIRFSYISRKKEASNF